MCGWGEVQCSTAIIVNYSGLTGTLSCPQAVTLVSVTAMFPCTVFILILGIFLTLVFIF